MFFNIGKKDEYGRQKRIEHRGKYLRVSRTGGVALRHQMRAAGLNVTANSRKGVRVSTRVAKGTNVAFQNGKFRLRGRYGKGPTKLNLSKSGISVSTRNALGTLNWMKPNRSSVKIAGVQMRGESAAIIQTVYMFFVIGFLAIKFAFVLAVFSAQIAYVGAKALVVFGCWLVPTVLDGVDQAQGYWLASTRKQQRKKLTPDAEAMARDAQIQDMDTEEIENALEMLVTFGGRGNPLDPGTEDILGDVTVERLRTLLIALTNEYRKRVNEPALVTLYFRMDDKCVKDGGRTYLQEILLEDYAAINQLKIQPDSADETDD